jgi:inosine/xanthosine triphosphatase
LIKVCVGSKNLSKIRGVEKAFKVLLGEVVVEGYPITGLLNQPIGLESIVNSARYRARKVMEVNPNCDFYVGVEAGLLEIKDLGYFDVHIACVVDKDNHEYYGFSPAFEVPRKFVEKILSGEFRELEEVVDFHYGTRGIGEKGGFISLLTKEAVVREELVYYSVIAALVPVANKQLYA